MKKTFPLLVSLAVLPLLFACQNEAVASIGQDIDLYAAKSTTTKGYSFELGQYDYQRGQDNRLVIDFRFSVTNNSTSSAGFSFSDAKAYGNDSLLQEQVLKTFDPEDKSKTEIFDNVSFSLNPNASFAFDFLLVIQDGNPQAKYQITFSLNDVHANLYAYDQGYELDRFLYVHDPTLYSKVLDDAEVDEKAVYGFKPNSTGSLKQYVDYAWESEKDVEGYKQERIKYIDENDQIIKDLENKMHAEGKSIEEIARACSLQRNQNRLDQYKNDPEGLQKLKERNLELYGHEEGPLPDELYEKYGSWEKVLEKCYATNAGMDACCGVYDMYFCMYAPMPY